MLKNLNTDNIFGSKQIPMAPQVSKDYASGAFEVKLIYEISKALMASHELFTVTCISLFNLIRFFMFSSSKL